MAPVCKALFLLLFSASARSQTSPTVASTCVDESRLQEQILYVGPQTPPYQLNCSTGSSRGQNSSSPLRPTWQKNCQQLRGQEGKSYLEFTNVTSADQGNYTCVQQGNSTASFTVRLTVKESQCSKPPEFKPNGGPNSLWSSVGSTASLNCTALLLQDQDQEQCDTTLRWSKDGHSLPNRTFHQNSSSWSPGAGQLVVTNLLTITLRQEEDFGLYSCTVRNVSSDFSVENSSRPSHTAAVIGASILLLLLGIAAIMYSRCHLSIKLWYRNSFGEYELNDGKIYDAYVSYVNNDHDRKFVNFILKPQLENRNGYKVHLNENDILPGGQPSAELLMNVSRSRRLIVLLSNAYLEQDWCISNFRQGLLHLLELHPRPILVLLEGQFKRMRSEIKGELSEQQHSFTILTWRQNSVTPSSDFWKELSLSMPRRVLFHSQYSGDPQTTRQDDKDPMLTDEPDYLNCHSDVDPAGDLGLRLPVYRALTRKAPVLPAAPVKAAVESKPADIDVSDLGSRNYAARSDFYCLVSEDI